MPLSIPDPNTTTTNAPPAEPSGRRFGTARSASLVAAGIFLSRISGLIRDRFFAHYLGNSAAADAFKPAIRPPTSLQNLFGERCLSSSVVPVFAAPLARKDKEEAEKT